MNRRTLAVALCFAASMALTTRDATAQTFAVEQFEPMHAQGTNNLNLAKSEVLNAWTPSFGLFVHYVDDPLVLANAETGEQVGALVGAQLKTEAWASIGLFDFADLGVVMPLVVWQDGDEFDTGDPVSGFAAGDLRVIPKFRLLEQGTLGGLGIGLLATVWLPTGDADTYNSDGGVRVEPRLVVDYTIGEFVILTNAGFQLRDTVNQRNFTSGNMLRWGAGVEVPLGLPKLKGLANVFGAVGLEDATDPAAFADEVSSQNTPVETDLALQYTFPYHLVAQAGAGFGVTESVGSPDLRIFASLGYTPRVKDSDGDGLIDRDDACPNDPEDKDGFEDSDGCPDPDNDKDGVLDLDDACPETPEDADGFEDADGCPDPDNDQDGIADTEDECPDVPGVAEKNGCPLEDEDGDGLIEDDQCPTQPEDKDGFEDEDGCPDPDNDGDGILDINDSCPDEPEVINGFEDEDGCPDEGETKVKVTEKKIEILEKVFFDTNKATIKDRSFNVLQQVATVLKRNPQITKIRVEGHTDSRGRDAYNMDLSKDRANSVRDFLINAGVEGERLVAEGFGETQPIDSNETAEGRERNRRVEFLIIEVNGKPAADAGEEAGVKDTSD
jgi:outer membrane protein OmpA-like peptidoglycan-associated protein